MKNLKNIDAYLWSKLKKGDASAIGDLYNNYVDDLFSYGIQFTNNKSEVMDSIHDLFLNLYKYRKKLADTDNVKYYLLRSLKNEILKTTKTNFTSYADDLSEKSKAKRFIKSTEEDLIASETKSDTSFKLNEALTSLTEKQRHILFLKYNEGKDYEEIATLLGVSVETSRTTIYRAIKQLRKSLLSILLFF